MYYNYIWLLLKLYLITDNYNYWLQLPQVCKKHSFYQGKKLKFILFLNQRKTTQNIIHILTGLFPTQFVFFCRKKYSRKTKIIKKVVQVIQ